MIITSVVNPRVKDALGLRKSRERRTSGRFLVEGSREVRRCLGSATLTEVVYHCPELGGQVDVPDGIERVEVSRAVFERMSLRDGPDGVLAVARDLDTSLGSIVLGPTPLVLVAAGIEKPGNLGTMIRSAAAAGATAVVVASGVVDVVNPNVIRTSQGSIFSMPIGVADDDEVIGWLGAHGIAAFAADPAASLPYWEAPLDRPAAVVIGAEHAGLSPTWRDAARAITIPMTAGEGVDSLNAAAAAAVLLFDAARRRVAAGVSAPPVGRRATSEP